jgi:hypothetical protein
LLLASLFTHSEPLLHSLFRISSKSAFPHTTPRPLLRLK